LVGSHLHAILAEDMSCRRLLGWLEMFPPGAMHGRLPLLVAEGHCCMIRWNFPGLEAALREIEGMGTGGSRKGDGEGAPFLQPDIDALWAQLLYWQGDVDGSLERSRRALAGNPEVGSRPWSLACVYRLGGLVLSGRLHEGVRQNEEAIAAVGPGSPSTAELLQAQGFAHLYALDLGSCRARALQMSDLDERVSVVNSRLGHAPYLLGLVAYERNLLDEAEAWFRRIEDLRYLVISGIYRDALIGRALVALARNDQEAVDTYCRDARAFATEVGDATSLDILRSFELRVALLRGLPPPEGLAPPPTDDHQSFWLEVPTVTWAMHLIAHDDPRQRASALGFIDGALARVERHHNRRVAVPLAILRALALDDRGDREAALDALADVVARAAPRGLVRSFVDCGPRVKELLDELAKRSESDDHIHSLRAGFGSTRQLSTALGPSDVLTYRELETLELLAWRMTNKEIAARLAVSSAAVKKRLDSIYAKLGVHDRRAAVAEAVERRLIQPPAP
jgi:LuxR family maltose regulon positive regulatory protein